MWINYIQIKNKPRRLSVTGWQLPLSRLCEICGLLLSTIGNKWHWLHTSALYIVKHSHANQHASKTVPINRWWRRIISTIEPFNQVYKNVHKITPLHSLVAHRQIRRQKRNVQLNILR